MATEIPDTQMSPAGRKAGGRKASPPAPERHVVADVPGLDQSFTAEDVLQGSAQVIAPIPFDFQGKAVRTIAKGNEIWFVATDACALLEHSNPRMAIGGLDEDQKGVSIISTAGGPQRANVVSESGLFTLIFTSRKPEAKAFRRWVTGVVLPTLRRTGKFEMRGEPSQSAITERQAEESAEITVTLPGPGRYLVVLFHNGEQRIEPLCFSDVVSALAALDCRSIAYSHLTAASLWEKLQHIRTGRADVSGGFTSDKLNATMQAGADLARQILYTYDEPMLNPRPAANSTRD